MVGQIVSAFFGCLAFFVRLAFFAGVQSEGLRGALNVLDDLFAMAPFQLGGDEGAIFKHVFVREEFREFRWCDAAASVLVAGGSCYFRLSAFEHGLFRHGLDSIVFADLGLRVDDFSTLLAHEFAPFGDGFRVDLRLCWWDALREHASSFVWLHDRGADKSGVLRLCGLHSFLPVPFLGDGLRDVHELFVGGLAEVGVRVCAQLFDVACGSCLCRLPCLHMPVFFARHHSRTLS